MEYYKARRMEGLQDIAEQKNQAQKSTYCGIPFIQRTQRAFPHISVCKKSTCNAGDPGSIPGSGRSPGEGEGYPLQYSGLENPCIVHGVTKNQTWLSNFHFTFKGYRKAIQIWPIRSQDTHTHKEVRILTFWRKWLERATKGLRCWSDSSS